MVLWLAYPLKLDFYKIKKLKLYILLVFLRKFRAFDTLEDKVIMKHVKITV